MITETPTGAGGPRRLIEQAQHLLTVERLVGEPIERDGTTLIPVVAIRGGGGGGGGTGQGDHGETGSGEGLGFGMSGRPVGSWVITHGHVEWQPAFDMTRIAGMVTGVLVAFFGFRWLTARASGSRS